MIKSTIAVALQILVWSSIFLMQHIISLLLLLLLLFTFNSPELTRGLTRGSPTYNHATKSMASEGLKRGREQRAREKKNMSKNKGEKICE
jgi:hypothetical protein